MPILGSLLLFAPVAGADPWSADDATTCDLLGQEEIDADTRWVRATDGVLDLVADAPPGMEWEARVTVSISGLTTSWTQAATADPEGHLVLRLSPPPSAFLHAVSADYLTGLRVHLYGSDGLSTLALSSPPAFLAWPGGQVAGPVVWDRTTAAILAPNGIVSTSARALAVDLDPTEMVEPNVGGE